MPFTTFALPLLRPRRWDVLGTLAAVLSVALVLSAMAEDGHRAALFALRPDRWWGQPWRLLTWGLAQPGPGRASLHMLAVVVGLTMASRTVGALAALAGLLAALVGGGFAALYLPSHPPFPLLGDGAPAFAALGLGGGAWLSMRDELSYRRRVDWLVGFGTLAVAGSALAAPWVMGSRWWWHDVAAFAVAFAAVLVAPRTWEPVVAPRGTLEGAVITPVDG